MTYRWLTPDEIAPWVPMMVALGVSEVARSSRGFLWAYAEAGSAARLDAKWHAQRNAFIARHMAQVRQRDEPLMVEGMPTRRHLALIAWAYSPLRAKLLRTEPPEVDDEGVPGEVL